MRKIFFFWGVVVCRWGELGWGRRRRNKGWEGRQSCHILTFFDGFTDGNSVGYYVGDSDGNIDTKPVASLYGHCTGTVRAVVLNPSVIPLEKNNPPKPPRQRPAFFLNSETFPFVIQSVNTDGKFSSVFTDWITDGKVFVGFYRRKVAVGNFDLKIPTELFRRYIRWYLANFW